MRILLVSHGYPPTISGVTVVVQKLALALVEHGHKVVVLTASDKKHPYRAIDAGIRLSRVRSVHNPIWSEGPIPVITFRTLKRAVNHFSPDVIHTHENFIIALQLTRLAGRQAPPMVVSCHALPDFAAQLFPQTFRLNRAVERFMWFYLVRLLNRFDAAVFATRTHRDLFIDHGLVTRPVIISNGVNATRFHPADGQKEDIVQRYKLPAGRRILFLGRLCVDKNLESLIQAMAEIWPSCQANLLLAGRGDNRAELERLVRELELQHCIHFLGYVPDEDLPALYRASDLFAITSKVEVQSLPTLQALVSGLPVVAADAGALPELVRNDVNGYLTAPDDVNAFARAVIRILQDPARLAQFGQASLDIGRQHEESMTFKAFMELYQQLVVSRWIWAPVPIWSEKQAGSTIKRERLY